MQRNILVVTFATAAPLKQVFRCLLFHLISLAHKLTVIVRQILVTANDSIDVASLLTFEPKPTMSSSLSGLIEQTTLNPLR